MEIRFQSYRTSRIDNPVQMAEYYDAELVIPYTKLESALKTKDFASSIDLASYRSVTPGFVQLYDQFSPIPLKTFMNERLFLVRKTGDKTFEKVEGLLEEEDLLELYVSNDHKTSIRPFVVALTKLRQSGLWVAPSKRSAVFALRYWQIHAFVKNFYGEKSQLVRDKSNGIVALEQLCPDLNFTQFREGVVKENKERLEEMEKQVLLSHYRQEEVDRFKQMVSSMSEQDQLLREMFDSEVLGMFARLPSHWETPIGEFLDHYCDDCYVTVYSSSHHCHIRRGIDSKLEDYFKLRFQQDVERSQE